MPDLLKAQPSCAQLRMHVFKAKASEEYHLVHIAVVTVGIDYKAPPVSRYISFAVHVRMVRAWKDPAVLERLNCKPPAKNKQSFHFLSIRVNGK